jgi:hypothetical protein
LWETEQGRETEERRFGALRARPILLCHHTVPVNRGR